MECPVLQRAVCERQAKLVFNYIRAVIVTHNPVVKIRGQVFHMFCEIHLSLLIQRIYIFSESFDFPFISEVTEQILLALLNQGQPLFHLLRIQLGHALLPGRNLLATRKGLG